MRAYAERSFLLSSRAGDAGETYRQVLEGLLLRTRDPKRRAEREAILKVPPMPAGLLYLWRIYDRMRRRKGGNGFALSPLEWQDIDAFLRRTQTDLAPWELEIIEMLDDLYLVDYSKLQVD
ncbi:hypothetical protein HAP47_0021040 [Bradyrhizobium sp. 41S5]|uniref:phage tail assembly chaperone n=1 Tax=Bradyrhizobium TaxID=374 RepID=UPI001CD3BA1A|nr:MULTISPECIES: hypothetical protein [Bradyrhizobium]UFX41792.1 hypothetical protein HAP47_0021040 [Bradyrhizobium sp. 41S5]UGA47098.1 hypothetical protein HU230_0014070 [Bradyrhizobium quebecense]